jgi:hypothetical protein
MRTVEQNTMVPYESIDPAGAAALRPGVSFLCSKMTIAEVIAQKGLCSWLKPIVANPALAETTVSHADAKQSPL